MNLQFNELIIVLLILALIGVMLLLMRQSEKTNEKLEKSYPADVKNLLEQMGSIVVGLAAKTSNTIDDQGAALLVAWLKGQGIDVPEVAATPSVTNVTVNAVPMKAPEIS